MKSESQSTANIDVQHSFIICTMARRQAGQTDIVRCLRTGLIEGVPGGRKDIHAAFFFLFLFLFIGLGITGTITFFENYRYLSDMIPVTDLVLHWS